MQENAEQASFLSDPDPIAVSAAAAAAAAVKTACNQSRVSSSLANLHLYL